MASEEQRGGGSTGHGLVQTVSNPNQTKPSRFGLGFRKLVLFGLVWFDRHPVWFGLVTNLVKPVQTGSNRFRQASVIIPVGGRD